ncbi:SDR family NAD(P)-dependent oxidoreductase [Reinekea blandensis]|uniref:Oxidoreductase, short-chain dehydrogenase/reductase family protein n=1 Tax=Reinekea blandensis MED297 TaxID=314283 RepID=A4BD22_9GAMM|nr:SDR family NAD(P)-dependent oxidoreductase [Reinekea blandensis]EAR10104.1 oxidoreductase, short-chain dehydrogenase/reductase family protein [Reinekea sp. MED297] [Reinekea blandensis MED297]
MNIASKTLIVTGAGNGIGRELTLQLLALGARVAGLDINEEALAETRRLAGEQADGLSTHTVNIADKDAVIAVVDEIRQQHGQIDGIINNAGIIQPFIRVKNLDQATIERVMNINFYGPLNLIQATLPDLLERPQAHILNVSSMGGFFPVPGQVVYGASKAALKLLTEGLYAELVDTNVGVTVVFPGAIMTNITENSGVKRDGEDAANPPKGAPKGTMPADAARQMIEAIESNRPRVFIGKDSRFMDRFYRLAPVRATRFMQKQMQKFIKLD